MNIVLLLDHLREHNIELWLDGETLRYRAPKGSMTEKLRSRLQEQKSAIVEALRQGSGTPSPTTALLERPEGELPLSFAQQRLWFLDQITPDDSSYIIPGALRLHGILNTLALTHSIEEIIQRHTVLRTVFPATTGEPIQSIASRMTIDIPIKDLSTNTNFQLKAEILREIAKEIQKPFNLACGPLLRTALVRLGPEEHLLLLATPHIVFDGWSMLIFVQELAAFYQAAKTGEAVQLPTLPLQYADYAYWQQQRLQGAFLATQITYWQRHLAGIPPLLEIPTDRPRPIIRAFRDGSHTVDISLERTIEVKEFSQREGMTVFMTLLSTFLVLLYRYTGQEDLVIGTPITNRARPEFEELIGCFINTLVLRTNMTGKPSFRELLQRVREVALQAYEHQEIPFERLVETLAQRTTSYAPLVQTMFVFQDTPMPILESADLTLYQIEATDEAWPFETTSAMMEDLVLIITEVDGRLKALVKYNAELYNATTIHKMMQHWQVLLEHAIAQPTQSIAMLPLLTASELQQILVSWNQSARAPYPADICIQRLFEKQVEDTPDTIALIFQDSQLTYYELNQQANQIAHYLRKQGVEPETLVGISMERSCEAIIAMLATLKAGGAFVPCDPTYPQERLAFMLQDSQISVLLTQKHLSNRLPEHGALTIHIDANQASMALESTANPLATASPDNLAYIIYTSGSTGKPKGVQISHRSIYNLAEAQRHLFNLGAADRVLQFAPLSFDASVWEFTMTLLVGATLHIAPQKDLLPGPDFHQLLLQQKITCVTLPPSALSLQSSGELPGLHTLIVAGEASSSELVARWREKHRFFNAYGPTEASVCATIQECQEDQEIVPMGRPIANTHIYLLDAALQVIPIGTTGEIYIGGEGLARGYLRRPELTAERFIPHPFSTKPGARLYRTGDLARYESDGTLVFLGRADTQVKIRGYRIELGEVEAALLKHPAVRDVAVLAQQDAAGDASLVAYISPHISYELQTKELRNFLKTLLPAYMLPSTFVILATLPLTANGKVDRRALSTRRDQSIDIEATYLPPQTSIEQMIGQVWEEVLKRERIGIQDNFFDLGGHSLKGVQIMKRLREIFHIDLPMYLLFNTPTIEGLAEIIMQKQIELIDEQKMLELWQHINQLSEEEATQLIGNHGREEREQ